MSGVSLEDSAINALQAWQLRKVVQYLTRLKVEMKQRGWSDAAVDSMLRSFMANIRRKAAKLERKVINPGASRSKRRGT
jgi:hypothetical protein